MKICKECGKSMFYHGAGNWVCWVCDPRYKGKIICQNCGKREATENWTGDGGTMGFIHGMYSKWCKICCLEAQLEHARKMASKIPELEKELEELKGKE